MARSFNRGTRAACAALAIAALALGCAEPKDSAVDVSPAPTAQSEAAAAAAAPAAAAPAAAPVTGINGRSGELLNPDTSTVVMLYLDLANLPVPLEQWVDGDNRVRMARPADKPAQRAAVRAELEAALAGVHNVGVIRLTMIANLSEYDATYGEFTVRAFAPSSMVEFKEYGQKVELKFGNARAAQVWRVPADQAQGVLDRIGLHGNVTADALLRIRDVHAAPEGGSITVDVVEYELRENRSGALLGRVQPAQQP